MNAKISDLDVVLTNRANLWSSLYILTKSIFFSLFLFISFTVFSQATSSGSTNLDIQKEEDVFQTRLSNFLPYSEKYRYPEFKEGRVYYTSHKESNPLQLNYNLLFKEVIMIAENGDTIFVANFEIIKYILIGKDLYYHDFKKGYFEIISSPDDSIRLAVQRKLKILKREVLRDTEKPELTSSSKIFSSMYVPVNPTFHREKVTLSREITFFLLKENNEPNIATKAAFIKAFPSHKQEIKKYLSQMARQRTPIKFYKEVDLKKLLQFCLALPS